MTKSPTDRFVLLSENLPSATLIQKWLGLATLVFAFAHFPSGNRKSKISNGWGFR
jgi:hypothetical protein